MAWRKYIPPENPLLLPSQLNLSIADSRETASGNNFINLIPFSKDPYKILAFQFLGKIVT
ncbi:hypothetical protein KSP40_PGU002249 [Platanthera guangdongensis]|uniref:Uncharacterized protein n=1 Tax=Platanthera guangdongensis TaxID=2320717 RepID=A0ABR2LIP5_9ASPA